MARRVAAHVPPRRPLRGSRLPAGLTKRYGRLAALENLRLQVPAGEVFGFLGNRQKVARVAAFADVLRKETFGGVLLLAGALIAWRVPAQDIRSSRR